MLDLLLRLRNLHKLPSPPMQEIPIQRRQNQVQAYLQHLPVLLMQEMLQ